MPASRTLVFGIVIAAVIAIAVCLAVFGPSSSSAPPGTTSFSGLGVDCTKADTLVGGWDSGKCLEGARAGLWGILLNGSNPHHDDSAQCAGQASPPGALSCEARAPNPNPNPNWVPLLRGPGPKGVGACPCGAQP
jgi:hypothetical protein